MENKSEVMNFGLSSDIIIRYNYEKVAFCINKNLQIGINKIPPDTDIINVGRTQKVYNVRYIEGE